MKSYTGYLRMHLAEERGFVNITAPVAAAVRKSGVREGLVLVNSMHITSRRSSGSDQKRFPAQESPSLGIALSRSSVVSTHAPTQRWTEPPGSEAHALARISPPPALESTAAWLEAQVRE